MGLREEGYWEKHYELELKNYKEDGDEGEIWFGRGLSRKIVSWIANRIFLKFQELNNKPDHINILDIGCGNAFLLHSLVDKIDSHDNEVMKHKMNYFGIDYSKNSVELSKRILADKNLEKVEIHQCDFLDRSQLSNVLGPSKMDYLIDKGTFDAICLLSSKSDESLLEAKKKFVESVYELIGTNSVFILASCNHTEEEVLSIFEIPTTNRVESRLIDRIESPKIQFGGKEGSQVSCIIMQFLSSCDK